MKKNTPDYRLKSLANEYDKKYHVIDCLSIVYFLQWLKELDINAYIEEFERRKKFYNLVFNTVCIAKSYSKLLFHECEKIYSAFNQRKKRLRSKIQDMFDNYDTIVFCTLTFSDDYLDNSNESARRDKVQRWFKHCAQFAIDYVPFCANIDFGSFYEREHYHGIIACEVPKIMLDFWRDNYGKQVKLQLVRKSTADKQALSTYINKLTNHAVKESTKRSHLIYSRKPTRKP